MRSATAFTSGWPTVSASGPATLPFSFSATALTDAVLLLLRASHPPAGATVLIVSLGFLQEPSEMLVLTAGVVLVTVGGWFVNRASGVPMPVWSARE